MAQKPAAYYLSYDYIHPEFKYRAKGWTLHRYKKDALQWIREQGHLNVVIEPLYKGQAHDA